jgi:serine/threonine protein kinase
MSSQGGGRTRVGRYELGRTLGEGTFAKVKFAKNVETGEKVAIKILDKEKLLRHKMIAQVIPFNPVISSAFWFYSSEITIGAGAKLKIKRFFPHPYLLCSSANSIQDFDARSDASCVFVRKRTV